MSDDLDLLAIGNAIVDVLIQRDDHFLDTHDLTKGAMTLIGPEQSQKLLDGANDARMMSGGSAANTVAMMSGMDQAVHFIGKVSDDEFGDYFAKDLRDLGVGYTTNPKQRGMATGTSVIIVTPDGERTMATHLGASVEFSPDDIDQTVIEQAQVVYLEGYLFDRPQAKEGFWQGARAAEEAGSLVALTLSDRFCVDRHRDDFLELINQHIDILFANESEAQSLYQTQDMAEIIFNFQETGSLICLTRHEKGSVIIKGERVIQIAPVRVDNVIDSTGAGDAYAAGFLSAYLNGEDLKTCGDSGSAAASRIIQQIGARLDGAVAA
jgi:sugar/nucleoside kinase (ribokinase family)